MPTVSDLEKEYIAKHPKSKELFGRAQNCYASGVSHDGRYARPFPIYFTRAERTRKWDVDGNEYVDYVMGHGGLLFGYGDEKVIEAFQEQLPKATHMGGCTELEIEWAELIQKLVPCAQGGFVRGTSCGGEAAQMALRLARIYTGRDKIVLHAGAYHGKGDATLLVRRGPPFGVYNVRGIPQGVREDVVTVPYNNLPAVEEAFACGDIACIMLQGNALYTKDYIEGLRKLTSRYGVVFIMDEVVSGFRYSAGGAQEYYGVTPDLTVIGKIIGGGAPVGAVCGKKEIMDYYSFKDDYWNRFVRVGVGGTWNAQPLSIVGGIAMMKIITAERDRIYPKIYEIGRRLTKNFNEQAKDLCLAAHAHGLPVDNPTTLSINLFSRPIPPEKMYLWKTGPRTLEEYSMKESFSAGGKAYYATYLSMINSGVFSYSGRGGSLCTKYTEEDLKRTEEAFAATLQVLKDNELVGRTD
jgi:glutamate-1-semialdehyde 2,1-aminomutase